MSKTKSLDLGCGATPRNPYNADVAYGIDMQETIDLNIVAADLVLEPIPFPDSTFTYVTAFDFLEHIPRLLYLPERRLPFLDLMSEIYRVLVPGGIFLSFTPAFPQPAAFEDPTHVNYITESMFVNSFCIPNVWATRYGFKGQFELLKPQEWIEGHLLSQMRKV